jgi:hypothetical protein
MMEMTIDSMQNSGELSAGNRPDGLYETNSDLSRYGDPDRFTIRTSLYQKASLHPLLVGALAVGGGLAIGALIKSQMNGQSTASGGEVTH